jgi:hypothetical protein
MTINISCNNTFIQWKETTLIIKLQQLGSAKKSLFWIHSDLSLTPITIIEKIIWKILSIIPCFRTWYFDTNLNKVRSILIQLKPLYESPNSKLRLAFIQAVLNFQRIAPKYRDGLDELIEPKNKIIDEIPKTELLFNC